MYKMAFQSAEKFKEIIMYLSTLRYVIKSRSKRKLYDLNKESEKFFCKLLNIVYDWELVDLNTRRENYPGIDLGGIKEKIAIQITAENTAKKIKKTINYFVDDSKKSEKLFERYDRLIILILTDKRKYTTQFETQNLVSFDKKEDIWDIDDLLSDIEKLDLDKLLLIHELVSDELQPIASLLADQKSLLSNIVDLEGIQPKDCNRFLDFSGCPEEEKKGSLVQIYKFFKKLKSLTSNSREFLFTLLDRGEIDHAYGREFIFVTPGEIEDHLKISEDKVKRQFDIIKGDLVSYEEADGDRPSGFHVSFYVKNDDYDWCGWNILIEIKNFFKETDKLKNLIVHVDFSELE